MKRIIALALLVPGFAMADPGMNQTPETQGWSTTTTINVVGDFASETSLDWTIASQDDIRAIDLTQSGDIAYQLTYTEDTVSNGLGQANYVKTLDAETMEVDSGLWNLEADKTLQFVGSNGARVISEDYNLIDGAGWGYAEGAAPTLCPFFPETGVELGMFCNVAQMGSTIDMNWVNVHTETSDRFIIPDSDTMVEKNYDITVTEVLPGTASYGSASAFMDLLVRESRDMGGELHEEIRFFEESSANGDITLFEKLMHYESGATR